MFEEEIITNKVNDIVQRILPEGIELIDLQLKGKGGKSILKILVDRTTGGISLEECADINRKLGEELDKEDFIQQRYILDVSSPGVNYPLKTFKDFKRNIGHIVKIETYNEIDGKKSFIGKLIEVKKTSILLEDKKDKKLDIPIENIIRAKQKV